MRARPAAAGRSVGGANEAARSFGERSVVTKREELRLEVFVVPYRSGDHFLADRYESILTRSLGVRMADFSRDHLRAAAQLRAATGLKTPDSMQLIAALAGGARFSSRTIASSL